MAVHSTPTTPSTAPGRRGPHPKRFAVTSWVLGILGGIAAVEGAIILFAGDEQSVGIGGDASWRVGDLDPAWGIGLLAGGILALLAAIVLALRASRRPADQEVGGWGDVVTHAVIFALVNAFLWAQDLALGGGVDFAYWVTIPWGIVLAWQALAQLAAGRRGSGGA